MLSTGEMTLSRYSYDKINMIRGDKQDTSWMIIWSFYEGKALETMMVK